MAVKRGDGVLAVQRFEHLGHRPDSNGEVATEGAEAFTKLVQRFVNEADLQCAVARRSYERRLEHVQAEDVAAGGGFDQRAVIPNAQIALEPNYLHGGRTLARS